MKSRVIQQKRKNSINSCRTMTPEQRLEAFANHSQLMTELREAGKIYFSQKHSKHKNYAR